MNAQLYCATHCSFFTTSERKAILFQGQEQMIIFAAKTNTCLMKKITILIVDDHNLVREGYALLLGADPRMEIVGKAATAEDALEIIDRSRPNVVLMDINLPGMNGIDAIKYVKQISPLTKILGVSMHTQISLVRKMLRQGAHGYITKCNGGEELCKAITAIYHNKKYICEYTKKDLANTSSTSDLHRVGFETLSQRELEIVTYVSNGFSSRQISQNIGISYKTVQAHRYNILRKMKLKNTPALVNYINHTGFEFRTSQDAGVAIP